jgi:hypothetical protein
MMGIATVAIIVCGVAFIFAIIYGARELAL